MDERPGDEKNLRAWGHEGHTRPEKFGGEVAWEKGLLFGVFKTQDSEE